MSGFGDEEEYRGTVTVVLPVAGGARRSERAEPSEPSEPPSGTKGATGAADAGVAADEGVAVRVQAHLAGHFSPLTGDYRWRGRLSPSPEVTEAFREGVRTVVVRTPDGFEGTGVLDEPNLWGGHPVNGAGSPPFAVPHVDIDASDD
ncbi:DUF4873 domain-containing protein [Nocardiopsis dassonvillei]|uniref:DUF4873 domain-containing protein n=1 Tax=Nocardiopsis dassonvillei TaxID=2014 RepID=UPI00200F6E6D|nr:DUF4873 domain-containing protein [Nocardiopsis dassonvillei]MCK9873220.1 DUF4873 domain-containing protein [Nocardiopsis dassonvillei]